MIDPMGSLVKLRKYHGLGNDFLVVLDVEGQRGATTGTWSSADHPGGSVASWEDLISLAASEPGRFGTRSHHQVLC